MTEKNILVALAYFIIITIVWTIIGMIIFGNRGYSYHITKFKQVCAMVLIGGPLFGILALFEFIGHKNIKSPFVRIDEWIHKLGED